MKKCFYLSLALAASSAFAATVSDVKVVQLWPWSTDVKITYVLSDVDSATDVQVKFYDGGTELAPPSLHNALSGDIHGLTTAGSKTIRLDPVKAFGRTPEALADFSIELTAGNAAANGNEVVYKIFDIAAKTCTDVTRNDIMNGKYGDYETEFSRIGDGFNTTLDDVLIWTAVTNGTTYKTDKLVMRKIPAAGVTWKIGANPGELGLGYQYENNREAQHTVRLTEDFYIGVFELTQSQFERLYGSAKGTFTNFVDSAVRPVETFSYIDIRGWGDLAGTRHSDEKVMWPTNSYRHDVFYNRLAGRMRSRFGVMFDLPTEARWEFACRAGTTNSLNSGKNLSSVASGHGCLVADEVAWTQYTDYSDAPGGEAQTRPVGLKKPNAYGLYDMHGNVEEWCLDCYASNIDVDGTGDPLVDPVGAIPADSKPNRTCRGGSWGQPQRYCRSAYRDGTWPHTQTKNYIGMRMVCPAAADWK